MLVMGVGMEFEFTAVITYGHGTEDPMVRGKNRQEILAAAQRAVRSGGSLARIAFIAQNEDVTLWRSGSGWLSAANQFIKK